MLMSKKKPLRREFTSESDWLEEVFEKSNSESSLNSAKSALKTFDIYAKSKLDIPDPDISDLEEKKTEKLKFRSGHCFTNRERSTINAEYIKAVNERYSPVYAKARATLLKEYADWFEAGDVQSICTSIQKWIRFMTKSNPDEKHRRVMTWKAKKLNSIKPYFAFLKAYLRKCHGIRITVDDVRDFITFPKQEKQAREATEVKDIKDLLTYCEPTRRALYYVLLTSGMRLSEALTLKKTNFKIDERPIQVHLRAQDTKTGEARDTFISEEAWERVAPVYERTLDGKYLFHDTTKEKAVRMECVVMNRTRRKIAKARGDVEPCEEFPEGTGILKHYENSIRYCIQIHAFRSWFMTQATLRHGSDYAHAVAGHHTYLDQYIRIPLKKRLKMYQELEGDLLLEGNRINSEQFHEAEIAEMQEKILKLEAMAVRKEEPDYNKDQFDGITN